MSLQKAHNLNVDFAQDKIAVALGQKKADLVIKDVQILDVVLGEFYTSDLAVFGSEIVGVASSYSGEIEINGKGMFAVPGFVDSHVHIESSLMTPPSFEQALLPVGTTTAIWDPHEITNVWGKDALVWATESVKHLILDVFIMLPSCVPATHLETSGATVSAADLLKFKHAYNVLGLAEFMNVPGVLFRDPEVLKKLLGFAGCVRDGHAPLVSGKELNAYAAMGISTCHECTQIGEAREKLRKGINVLIREGSCAKDAAELLPALNAHTSPFMALCSDDRNPLDIAKEGHISHIIELGLEKNIAPEILFRSASLTGAQIYGLNDRGVLAPGYLADIVLLSQKEQGKWNKGFKIEKVFKNGVEIKAAALNKSDDIHQKLLPQHRSKNINIKPVSAGDFAIKAKNTKPKCRVIEIIPNKIITNVCESTLAINESGNIVSSVREDILKLAVVERHHGTGNIGRAFVKGMGLKHGAIATSIGHDSHNITVVGCNDEIICKAVSAIEAINGGIVVLDEKGAILASLSLPIGGLMTSDSPQVVAQKLVELKHAAKKIGCTLNEPFLQLSFLPLPVIPNLKLTDKGLVDVNKFAFVDVEIC